MINGDGLYKGTLESYAVTRGSVVRRFTWAVVQCASRDGLTSTSAGNQRPMSASTCEEDSSQTTDRLADIQRARAGAPLPSKTVRGC